MKEKENETIVEDVQEEDLLENQELVEESKKDSEEVVEESLSKGILNVLFEEEEKKNDKIEEAKKEESEDEEESDEDDSEDEEDEDEEDMEEEAKTQTLAGAQLETFELLKGMKKHDLVEVYKNLHGEESEVPSTKADLVNSIFENVKELSKEELFETRDLISGIVKEDKIEKENEQAFAEDLKILTDSESNLTEEFKGKVSILFEASVSNRVSEIKEDLEERYNDSLQEEVTYVREALVDKIDSYLDYVVEEWMAENSEFIENKIRLETAENFMNSLKDLFTENYIDVPESKLDLVDSLSEDVEELKKELANVKEEKDSTLAELQKIQKQKAIDEVSSDLTSTDSERFARLVESVEFESIESFERKLQIVKENFFSNDVEMEDEILESSGTKEIIVEGEGDLNRELSPEMQAYVKALSNSAL